MKKAKHYRIISLNEDFGNNTKGTIMRCEAILASRLIDRQVASIYDGDVAVGGVIEQLEKNEEVKPIKNKKAK